MTRRAAIVGGGIGGLATAIHLSDRGWDVDVFERASGLPEAGTALGLWPGALAALDRLGIGAAVRERGRRQTRGSLRRPDGGVLASLETQELYLASRPLLLGLLAGRLDAGIVRFGAEVDDVRAVAGYDAVVAADGIGSRARAALFGDRYSARPSGVVAWRGTLEGPTETFSETWGRGALFGVSPQEAGRTNWFATLREGTFAEADDVSLLRSWFGGWHGDVRAVLDRLDDSAVLRHELWHLGRPLPSYVAGRIALIGDAAHAMLPNLGRGACEALVDGVTLAGALAEEPTVAGGLAAYDAARRRTTQRLVRAAWVVNRVATARRFTGVRDLAVRLGDVAAPRRRRSADPAESARLP